MSEVPVGIITFDDFKKLKLVVGTIVSVDNHPAADKLYVINVTLGDEQRQICAGIKQYYAPEQLVGKQIVLVANLAPRMLRGVESRGMLLAAQAGEQVVLISPEKNLPPGALVG